MPNYREPKKTSSCLGASSAAASAANVATLGMAIAATLFTTAALASINLPDGNVLKKRIKLIQSKYQSELDNIRDKANKLRDYSPSDIEVITGVEGDVKMQRNEIKLHIPEFRMRLQTWKLHVPEVKMKLQKWVFHLPDICMRYKKFPWGGGMHIPEPCMKKHKVKLHVPEVAMKLQTWKLHIPEVAMKLQRWVFHLPSVTVGNVDSKLKKAEAQGKELGKRAREIGEKMRAEINDLTHGFLRKTRDQIVAQFAEPIKSLKRNIASAPNAKLKKRLIAYLRKIEDERTKALRTVDAQIAAVS